jgi:hypothetical protein
MCVKGLHKRHGNEKNDHQEGDYLAAIFLNMALFNFQDDAKLHLNFKKSIFNFKIVPSLTDNSWHSDFQH